MGCGSSTFSSVVPADGDDFRSNGVERKIQNGHDHGENSDALRNGAEGQHASAEGLPTLFLEDQPAKIKPPLAFEISIEEFVPAENFKKHPPKRIQKLEERTEPITSIEDIKEKQAEAENRRILILQQRIVSASKRTQKVAKMIYGETKIMESDNGIEGLQITPRMPEMKNALAPPDIKLR